MQVFADFLNNVAKGLSNKAEALLVFGLAGIALFLVSLHVDPVLALGFPAALYLLYVFRAERSDRHDETIAKLDIEKIERDRGARLAQRKKKMLAKKSK